MPIRRNKDGEPYQDAAKRRARITFLDQAIVADGSGSAESWSPASSPDTTWAEIASVSGMDVIKAGQDVAEVKIIATVRYKPPGRRATMRFQDLRGNVYVIQAVRDIDPGRIVFQELTCLLLSQ